MNAADRMVFCVLLIRVCTVIVSMLSYQPSMPNTKSAEKAVRSSKRKNVHNLFWTKRIKDVLRSIKKGIDSNESEEVLRTKFIALQKVLDKSAKEKVIHKNRANRLKSIYAEKIAALSKPEQKSKPGRKPAK